MKQQLNRILSKMIGVTPAIVRYKNDDSVESRMIHITEHNTDTMICCMEEGEILPTENKNVTVIIKNNKHYLHCQGEVSSSFLNGRLFKMDLMKAALFIRKTEKDMSWLQQLYKYDQAVD
ncbi:MAG: hypothetical protein H7Y31_08770 [Chitinophagaceae bacterium]|nr:hypothetical protein [Chitinophagaceae bacterium]